MAQATKVLSVAAVMAALLPAVGLPGGGRPEPNPPAAPVQDGQAKDDPAKNRSVFLAMKTTRGTNKGGLEAIFEKLVLPQNTEDGKVLFNWTSIEVQPITKDFYDKLLKLNIPQAVVDRQLTHG